MTRQEVCKKLLQAERFNEEYINAWRLDYDMYARAFDLGLPFYNFNGFENAFKVSDVERMKENCHVV